MANQYINNMSDLWNSSGTTYTSIRMNVTNAASATDSKLLQLLVGTANRFSVDKTGNAVAVGTITSAGVVSSGGTVPSANDSAALGASGTAWSDLFLASGGVINWNTADVTITHATDQLVFAGAASGYSFSHVIQPTANDGAAIGAATASWSDLFLATGAVVNYGNGNWVATHSDGAVTVGTGDLRVTNAGTGSTSAVTVGGTQTLTNKTMTSPTLNSASLVSPTVVGTPTAGSATWTNLGSVTTCDINGGTIDGTVIGATTPAAVTASTITATSSSVSTLAASTSVSAPTGTFASSVYGGSVNTSQVVQSTAANIILSPAAGLNTIYFRPRGYADGTGQVYIDNAGGIVTGGGISCGSFSTSGSVAASGNVTAAGYVFSTAGYMIGTGPHVVLGTSGSQGGIVYLRPNGYANGSGQVTVDSAGSLASGANITAAGAVTSGQVFASSSGNAILAASGGATYFRPNGQSSATGQWYIDGSGNLIAQSAAAAATGGVYAGCGIRGKFGYQGGYGANWQNFVYSAGFTYLYVDATNFGAISTSSDYRIKKEVTNLPSKWDTVKALRPISYTHTDFGDLIQSDEIERWGFIAHELQETLIPSAATGTKDEENLIQSPNPWTVIAALTSALQEAMTRIEALEEAANG